MIFVDRIDQKYVFVLAASLRARQLQGGAQPLIEVPGGMKITRIAMEEVLADKIPIDAPPIPGEEETVGKRAKKKK